jgi:hypothetical protein
MARWISSNNKTDRHDITEIEKKNPTQSWHRLISIVSKPITPKVYPLKYAHKLASIISQLINDPNQVASTIRFISTYPTFWKIDITGKKWKLDK